MEWCRKVRIYIVGSNEIPYKDERLILFRPFSIQFTRLGSMIVKPNVVKIRRILPKTGTDEEKEAGATIVGFAGSTADAFTLLERLEGKLDEYPGQLARSCVELAKGWRTDKYLRRLEASLIVADSSISLELSGNGDVLESHDGVLSVGSGSPYAKG
jgi:ATP-dependent HslUV protease subunit HslV